MDQILLESEVIFKGFQGGGPSENSTPVKNLSSFYNRT